MRIFIDGIRHFYIDVIISIVLYYVKRKHWIRKNDESPFINGNYEIVYQRYGDTSVVLIIKSVAY